MASWDVTRALPPPHNGAEEGHTCQLTLQVGYTSARGSIPEFFLTLRLYREQVPRAAPD